MIRRKLLFLICIFYFPVMAYASDNDRQIQELRQQIIMLQKSLNAVKGDLARISTQHKQSAARAKSHQSVQHNVARPTRHVEDKSPESIYRHQGPQTDYAFRTRAYFDSSHLLVNVSSMNEDLAILQHRRRMEEFYPPALKPKQSRVVVSGELDGNYSYKDAFSGVVSQDIDLSGATLDVFGAASPWAFAFMSFVYDNNASDATGASVNRVQNSSVHLARAFITMGHLTKSPVYGTVGQFYLPFGRYSSFMVTSANTKKVGRILQRALQWGYAGEHTGAQVYVFKGATTVGGSQNRIAEGGANLMSQGHWFGWYWRAAVGGVSNLAESEEMQTDLFGSSAASETLRHRVPAVDAHVELSHGDFGVNLEWLGAVRRFNAANLMYTEDGVPRGAKPSAFHGELIWHTRLWQLPSALALAYGQTQQSLAMGLPRKSYAAVFSTSWWQDTSFAVEYRYDKNYPSNAQTNVQSAGATSPDSKSHQQRLTAQFSLYF
jgi:hypothetical protein